jgi:hypothetical protein
MLGAVAGGAGLAAMMGSGTADAATGDPVLAGDQVDAENSTVIFADSGSFPFGLLAVTDTAFDDYAPGFPSQAAVTGYAGTVESGQVGVAGYGAAKGIYGQGGTSGVRGVGSTYGVYGTGATGVYGNGVTYGVQGDTGVFSHNGPGVFGSGDTGVYGVGNTYGVYGVGLATGVFAEGDSYGLQASGATAMYGSGTVYGVEGYIGPTGAAGLPGAAGVIGVDNTADGGTALAGVSSIGTGVLASSAAGTALAVEGSSTFTGTTSFSRSGVVSIAAGRSSAMVTDVALTAASLVLSTLQSSIKKVYVEAVVPNVSGSSFEILLSKAVPAGHTASIGWFVVN